jgi:DNA-binding transcriptional regulator WhiA
MSFTKETKETLHKADIKNWVPNYIVYALFKQEFDVKFSGLISDACEAIYYVSYEQLLEVMNKDRVFYHSKIDWCYKPEVFCVIRYLESLKQQNCSVFDIIELHEEHKQELASKKIEREATSLMNEFYNRNY